MAVDAKQGHGLFDDFHGTRPVAFPSQTAPLIRKADAAVVFVGHAVEYLSPDFSVPGDGVCRDHFVLPHSCKYECLS